MPQKTFNFFLSFTKINVAKIRKNGFWVMQKNIGQFTYLPQYNTQSPLSQIDSTGNAFPLHKVCSNKNTLHYANPQRSFK